MISNNKDLKRIYSKINERYGVSKTEMDDLKRADKKENRYNQEVISLQSRIEDEETRMQRDERAGNENSAARRRSQIARLQQRLGKAKQNKDRYQNKKEKIDNV